jgi:hypothetical protein
VDALLSGQGERKPVRRDQRKMVLLMGMAARFYRGELDRWYLLRGLVCRAVRLDGSGPT